MKLIDPETNKEYEFEETHFVSSLNGDYQRGTLKPVEGSVQNVPNPKGGVQNEPVLDKELEKILQNEFGSGTENGVYVDDFVGTVAQIKSTILKELEKEMPTPEEEGFEGKDPSVFPNERNYEATTRNELLADCLEVVRKTLQ